MLLANIEEKMISDENVKKLIEVGIDYIKNTDLENIKIGNYVISDRTIMQVHEYQTKNSAEQNYESHRKHLDLHYMIKGREKIFISKETNPKLITEYIKERDITFYESNLSVYNELVLNSGDFLITEINELHKPGCMVDGPENIKKIVLKIEVE